MDFYRIKKIKSGVTLTELLITTGLMFVVILGIIELQEMGYNSFSSVADKVSLQTTANYAMEKIVRSIRDSQNAEILYGGIGLNLDNNIEFRLDNENKILYYSNTQDSIANEILSKHITFLNFFSDGRSILIRLKVEEGKRSLELFSRSTLRNP